MTTSPTTGIVRPVKPAPEGAGHPLALDGAKLSISDTVATLTGFEEQAIEDRFGRTIADLLSQDAVKACRALLFVLARRAGDKDGDAYKAVMEFRLKDVDSRFQSEDEDQDDFDPDHPESEQGKDD